MHCWNCTKRDQSTEHSVLRSLFDILQMALIQQNVIQNKFLIFCIHMVQCIQNLVHSRILLSITFREKIRQEIFQPDLQFVTEQTEHLKRGRCSSCVRCFICLLEKKFDGHLYAFDGHFGYKEEKCGIVQKSENFCLQF